MHQGAVLSGPLVGEGMWDQDVGPHLQVSCEGTTGC